MNPLDGLFGSFLWAVAHMRELQRVPLSEWSAGKAHQLDRATAEVDSQIQMFLTRSVMQDTFGPLIDAMHGEHS